MQAIYIILFITTLLISTMSLTSKNSLPVPGDATGNFLTYRDAVVDYAENNTLINGTISLSSLTLPNDWLPASAWSNQVIGNVVYIWGDLSAKGKKELEEITYCSQAYFYSTGFATQAICTGTAGPTLPVSLPDKTIVSAIEVH